MQGMISRIYAQQIKDKLSKFPVVAILGPRIASQVIQFFFIAAIVAGGLHDVQIPM